MPPVLRAAPPSLTRRLCAAALLCLVLGACSEPVPRYYAQAGHDQASYSEVRGDGQVQPLRLDLRFLRDGVDDPAAAQRVRGAVLAVLQRVGSFQVSDDAQVANQLRVVVQGHRAPGDLEGLGPDGVVTRLLAIDAANGSSTDALIQDRYRFELSYRHGSQPERIAHYQHAVMSSLGDKRQGPDVRGPYKTPEQAFDVVVQDVVLDFLRQLQSGPDSSAPMVYLR